MQMKWIKWNKKIGEMELKWWKKRIEVMEQFGIKMVEKD